MSRNLHFARGVAPRRMTWAAIHARVAPVARRGPLDKRIERAQAQRCA